MTVTGDLRIAARNVEEGKLGLGSFAALMGVIAIGLGRAELAAFGVNAAAGEQARN